MNTIVVSAYKTANFPEGGGHFWVYMQYVQALRQLGCDVYWLENFRGSGDRAEGEIDRPSDRVLCRDILFSTE